MDILLDVLKTKNKMKKLIIIATCLLMTFAYSCTKDNEQEIKKKKEVTSIALDITDLSLNTRKAKTIKATILPEDAIDKSLIWESSDESIVTVDENGKIKAHDKGGKAIVTVRSVNDITATCNVTVTKVPVHVTGITVDPQYYTIYPGDTFTINPVIEPEDAVNKDLIITIDNEDVVSHDGYTFTALKEGDATITLKPVDGGQMVQSQIIVFVDPKPTSECVDADGKEYKTVKIGDQVWMAENLAYLPKLSEQTGKEGENSAKCYYVFDYTGTDLDQAKAHPNYSKYGVLYNFEAAKVSCPKGWHLPSKDEFQKLKDFVSANGDKSGEVLKSTTGWDETGNGNNKTGFNMLGGGYYNYSNYMFIYESQMSFLLSSTPKVDNPNVYTLGFVYVHQKAIVQAFSTQCGFYIRCIKD